MSKKSKSQKRQHPTGYKNPEGGNKLNQKPGSAIVSGKVEAGFPPNLAEKHEAANHEQDSWNRKKFRVELATAILLLIYTTIAAWQGCLSRNLVITANKTFEAANRPYVGLDGVGVIFVAGDPKALS